MSHLVIPAVAVSAQAGTQEPLQLCRWVRLMRWRSARDDRLEGCVTKLPQAVPTVQVDNERVRVTEWRFAPGAETGEHVHQMDYVVVPLGDGRLKLVSPAGEESFADLKLGVSYARKAGVHHNVINANAFEYAFVEIELKN